MVSIPFIMGLGFIHSRIIHQPKKILALKQNPNIPFLETKRSSISLTPKPSPLANLTPRWHLCTLGTQDLEVTFCLHGMTIQLL